MNTTVDTTVDMTEDLEVVCLPEMPEKATTVAELNVRVTENINFCLDRCQFRLYVACWALGYLAQHARRACEVSFFPSQAGNRDRTLPFQKPDH